VSGLRLDVISLAPEGLRAAPGPWRDWPGPLAAGLRNSHPQSPGTSPPIANRKVDDEPYGGGAGHCDKPNRCSHAFEVDSAAARRRVLLNDPQGQPFQQQDLRPLAGDYGPAGVLSAANYGASTSADSRPG